MTAFGKRLIAAAKEARTIARGEAKAGAYKVHVPAEIDVKSLRDQFHLSQAGFAQRFGFNPARIKDWEQGRSHPDPAMRAYLIVIKKDPKAVERALRA